MGDHINWVCIVGGIEAVAFIHSSQHFSATPARAARLEMQSPAGRSPRPQGGRSPSGSVGDEELVNFVEQLEVGAPTRSRQVLQPSVQQCGSAGGGCIVSLSSTNGISAALSNNRPHNCSSNESSL